MPGRLISEIYVWVAVASLVMIVGCDLLNPDRELKTQDGVLARIIEDNPAVESLFSAERSRDAEADRLMRDVLSHTEGLSDTEGAKWFEIMRNPERITPGRREFLLAMSRQSGISVPGGTYARSLESSGPKCTLHPQELSAYIKVRITSGPFRGREGWVCEDDVFRTVVWP